MYKVKRILFLCIVLSVLIVSLVNIVSAQIDWSKYPERDISIVIDYSPGGGSDTLAQAVQPYLSKYLGVSLINVYKPGANAAVGLTYWVENLKPDSYNMNITCTPGTYGNPIMNPKEVTYSMDQIEPVFNIVTDPGVLLVRADSPFQTFEEFIAYAKENPSLVTVGNSGTGGDDWISVNLLNQQAGIDIIAVPFAGDGPSWQAALGGHITATSNNLGITYPQIKDGALRALVIYTEERSPLIPDVPTAKELGYDIVNGSSRGYSVLKGTPQEAIDKLEEAFWKVMGDKEFLANAEKIGLPLNPLGPEDYSKYLDKLAKDFKVVWEKVNQ